MSAPSAKKLFLPVAASLFLALCIAWMAGVFTHKVPPEGLSFTSEHTQKPYTVLSRKQARTESVPAGIRARERTLISSRIIARIEKIHVRAGDRVTKGQALITLENEGIEAQIAQAHARMDSIQAQLDEAKLTLERTQSLRQQGLVSSSDLDKAKANFNKLSSDLLAAAQSEKEARTALGYSNIVSPIDGRIVERSAEPGNMASPGQPLLSLYNPLSMLVEADVRESLAVALKIGEQVTVNVEALQKTIAARISEKIPAADPNARSFVVKADVPFDEDLLPGMFARMEIELEDVEQLMIPVEYIYTFGQLDMVWVVSNGQLSRRFIRIAEQIGNEVTVAAGLESGEVIAIKVL